jgi:hypothetical protein
MRVNSLDGPLKKAEVTIKIGNQALKAKDPYAAGEIHDELEMAKMSLIAQKFIEEISGGIIENFKISDTISRLEDLQSKLEVMADNVGEDYTEEMVGE